MKRRLLKNYDEYEDTDIGDFVDVKKLNFADTSGDQYKVIQTYFTSPNNRDYSPKTTVKSNLKDKDEVSEV